jgi:DNA-directed RNA polymerase specialized sigma24 family protein
VVVVEAETDGTLIERSCRGRPDAFVEVVRRHETAVHNFLVRRAEPQVAADLLGEVWLRGVRRARRLPPCSPGCAAVAVRDRQERAAGALAGRPCPR